MAKAIEFDAGEETLTGYYADPGQCVGQVGGIVLAPAIAGVNDYVLRVADRLAGCGFGVLLIDYYCREGSPPNTSNPEAIGRAVGALSDTRTILDMSAAALHLASMPRINPDAIGSLGFCIGGMYAYLLACEEAGLKAAVDYYGLIKYAAISDKKPVSPLDMVSQLNAPLLAHYGTYDRLISAEDIAAFDSALKDKEKSYEMLLYRGAPHAFDEDFRPTNYRPVASARAWRATIDFFRWHLHDNAPR